MDNDNRCKLINQPDKSVIAVVFIDMIQQKRAISIIGALPYVVDNLYNNMVLRLAEFVSLLLIYITFSSTFVAAGIGIYYFIRGRLTVKPSTDPMQLA